MRLKELVKTYYHRLKNKNTSYSQTGEDLIAAFFLSGVKKGFYVDVGTNDPIYLNNTYLFYKKGWRGVCVEPNKFRCRLIKLSRPGDSVLNVGVGPNEGKMDFYEFDPDTISTFSPTEAEEFKKLGHQLLKTTPVQVKTLGQILKEASAPKSIDLLSTDTEGLDLDVLKSNDWAVFRPKIIIAEVAEYRRHTAVRTEKVFSEFLAVQGYKKLADTFINGIYIESGFAQSQHLEI